MEGIYELVEYASVEMLLLLLGLADLGISNADIVPSSLEEEEEEGPL